MGVFRKDESDLMYERFRRVSKDITDHYKKPIEQGGYTDDDNKAVEELIVKMEKLNGFLEKYDACQTEPVTPIGGSSSGGSGGGPRSLRGFFESIFGVNR